MKSSGTVRNLIVQHPGSEPSYSKYKIMLELFLVRHNQNHCFIACNVNLSSFFLFSFFLFFFFFFFCCCTHLHNNIDVDVCIHAIFLCNNMNNGSFVTTRMHFFSECTNHALHNSWYVSV